MMKLYDFAPCPFGQKVRIVLAEKGLSYEMVHIDISQGEHRKPDFMRLNPYARVPVLVDEDTTIYDSTVIDEYLEDEYPDPSLLPAVGASALRARARLFEDFADNSFTPQVGQLMVEMFKPEAERDANRVARLRQSIERVLDYLNHELQGQQYLANDFSVADIGFIPRILVVPALEIDAAANRPNIEQWLKRIYDRASIQTLEGVTAEPLAGV